MIALLSSPQSLYDSGAVIIILIPLSRHLAALLEAAETVGLMADHYGYVIISAGLDESEAANDISYARRLHGMLDFEFDPSTTEGFRRLERVWSSLTPADCANPLFKASQSLFDSPPPVHAATTYDAVVAMSIAYGSSVDAYDHSGVGGRARASDVFAQLAGMSFDGSSGTVQLRRESGDRESVGTTYVLRNFVYNKTRRGELQVLPTVVHTISEQDDESLPSSRGQPGCASPVAPTSNHTKKDVSPPLKVHLCLCRRCPCQQKFQAPPPEDSNGYLLASVADGVYRYRSQYGLESCLAHDLGTLPSCVGGGLLPAWCSRPWCYVDPDVCDGVTFASYYFPGTELVFSYQTCTTQQALNQIVFKGGEGVLPIDLTSLGCPAGQEAFDDLTICRACPIGTAKLLRATAPCIPCEAGTVQPSRGQETCIQCPPGTFQDEGGKVACKDCAPRHATLPGGGACACAPSYFLFRGTCEACPNNAACQLNSKVTNLIIAPDHYRLNNRSTDIRECFKPLAGDFHACLGGNNSADDGLCAVGHRGPLCSVCVEDAHFIDWTTGRCKPCGDQSTATFACLGALLGIVLLIANVAVVIRLKIVENLAGNCARAMTNCTSVIRSSCGGGISSGPDEASPNRRPRSNDASQIHGGYPAYARRLSSLLRKAIMVAQNHGLVNHMKQVVGFYQILVAAPLIFTLQLPDEFDSLSRAFVWVDFDVLTWAVPSACFGTYTVRLLLSTVWPLVLIAFAVLVGGLLSLRVHYRAAVRRAVVAFSLLLVFLVVPVASSTTFYSFVCASFELDSEADSSKSARFLVLDMNIRCPDESGESSAEYDELSAYATIMIVVWPVGMPICFFFLALRDVRRKGEARIAAFLTQGYRPAYYWWEVCPIPVQLSMSCLACHSSYR